MSRSARERMIEAAHDLFYRVGFHAVGLDAILSAVGVTKTTFYNHFETKDDLVREVLVWHDRWWQDTFRRLLREHGGDVPRDQLLALPDAVNAVLEHREFNGCFFINVAVQFPQAHDPAHQMAAAHKRAMEGIIREISGYAGARDAQSMAQELSMALEGAYVTRQVTGNPATTEVFRRLVNLVAAKYLGA